MVSLKKMKIRTPSFKLRKNKSKKIDILDEEADSEPTVEITPVESDPIMEDREDAEETNVAPSRSNGGEITETTDDERSPPDDTEAEPEPEAEEKAAEAVAELGAKPKAESTAKAAEDESVVTDAEAEATGDDALSTVKEEPSKEEDEEKSAGEVATPPSEKEPEARATPTQTMEEDDDKDITLDATDTSVNESGCNNDLLKTVPVQVPGCASPVNAPAFCGCMFEKLLG